MFLSPSVSGKISCIFHAVNFSRSEESASHLKKGCQLMYSVCSFQIGDGNNLSCLEHFPESLQNEDRVETESI